MLMSYTPDLRTPIVHSFTPWKYHPTDCPRCFMLDWETEDSASVHLDDILDRMTQTNRGIMMMPMGKTRGWFASSQWHTGEKWRQDLLIDKINDWLRIDRRRTMELFIGCRPANPHHLSMAGCRAPDPSDPVALSSFCATVLPWITRTKIHRLWLDHSSTAFNYPAVQRLSPWCRAMHGLQLGIEAFRTTHVGPGEWDLDELALEREPAFALSKFVQQRDADEQWICPPGAEALVICRRTDNPTQDWVDGLRDRGFTVGSVSISTDSLVV